MKTIYLFRHSSPKKNSTLTNEFIPISKAGEKLMKQLVNKLNIPYPVKVFSSPYVRTKQTAEVITLDVLTDIRLIERKIGDKNTFTKDLWSKQYIDLDVMNVNGESFRMVQNRMNEFMNETIKKMDDGQCTIVVSHAAAICAYLQKYCFIEVVDVDTKHRKIVFKNETIFDGAIKAPSCFILVFDDELISISYVE